MTFIKHYFVENEKTNSNQYKPLMPVEIYCCPDTPDIWLGPGNRGGQGEGNLRVNLIMYEKDIRRREDLYGPFWTALMQNTSLARSCKFHWGKYQPMNSHDKLASLYQPLENQPETVMSAGNMAKFLDTRAKVDPLGVLMNDHYNNLLGLSYPPEKSEFEKRVRTSHDRSISSAFWFSIILSITITALLVLMLYTFPFQQITSKLDIAIEKCIVPNGEFSKIVMCLSTSDDLELKDAMLTLTNVLKSLVCIVLNFVCAVSGFHFYFSARMRYVYKGVLQTAVFANVGFALAEGTLLIKVIDPKRFQHGQSDRQTLLMIYQTLVCFGVSIVGAISLSELSDYCSNDIFQKYLFPNKSKLYQFLEKIIAASSLAFLGTLVALVVAMQMFITSEMSADFAIHNAHMVFAVLQYIPLLVALLLTVISGFMFTRNPKFFLSALNFSFAYQSCTLFWNLMELSDHYLGAFNRSNHEIAFMMASAFVLLISCVVTIFCRMASHKYCAIEPMKTESFESIWSSARAVIIFCWVQAGSALLFGACYTYMYQLVGVSATSVLYSCIRVLVVVCVNFISFYVGVTRYQKIPSYYLNFLELSNVANAALYLVDTDLRYGEIFLKPDMPAVAKVVFVFIIGLLILTPFVALIIIQVPLFVSV